jgi:DNA-binding CsgD family transcriptional regulator
MHCLADLPEASTLQQLTAADDYARRVSEVVQLIPAAADEVEAVGLLFDAAQRLGADVAAFGSFVRDDGSHESYRFLLACDAVWCHEYEKRAWYANDPWLAYASRHAEPARASEIPVSSSQQAIVELASEYGFRSAVIIPAPASGTLTRIGVLCLGSARRGFFEDSGYLSLKIAARSLAMEMHDWWIGQAKRELISSARITDEDLLLLRHEREGHSTKEIATQLDTSPSSINSRFQRVNLKLGVPNRRAAATLASEYGLI